MVRLTKVVAPSPRFSVTLAAATRVTFVAFARVTCSKEKSPDKVCPATPSTRFVPSSRTYGPAGTFRFTAAVPTVMVSLTTALVVLMRSLTWPLNVARNAGVVLMLALTWPANPAAVTTKLPVPLVTLTSAVLPSPKLKLPFATPTRSTV